MALSRRRHTLRLIDNSDESWREFGEQDPYFGVLTEDKFRKSNLTAETLKEFFDSGEDRVAAVLATLYKQVTPSLPKGDALDFGCGVGRLVIPPAARFSQVSGIDISDAYRSEALSNCQSRNIHNVQFLETLAPLMEREARFDLVHSSIVFNHIPWNRGGPIIQQMFDLLRPGGALAIQIKLSRHRSSFRKAGAWLRRNCLPFNWLVNVARGRPAFEPLIQGNAHPLEELLPLLKQRGASNFHIELEDMAGGHFFATLFCAKVP